MAAGKIQLKQKVVFLVKVINKILNQIWMTANKTDYMAAEAGVLKTTTSQFS